MQKCIICLEDKDNFNDEHVIPDVLGGVYIINSVCTDCNSDLGRRVDIKIINEFAAKNFRHDYQLSGKSGKLPVVFPGTYNNALNEKEKYRFDQDENGKTTTKLIYSECEIIDLGDGRYNVKINFDDSIGPEERQRQASKIIAAEMKKRGLKHEVVHQEEVKVESPVKLTMNLEISSSDSFIAILKMAYEFACANVDGYRDDSLVPRIAGVLENARYSDALDYVKGHNTYALPRDDAFSRIFSINEGRHLLLLNDFDGRLGCIVYLSGIGGYGIRLSDRSYFRSLPQGGLLLINDVKERQYEILSVGEYVVKHGIRLLSRENDCGDNY